jgi:phosphoglycolate phosphatase
MTYVVWDWNGTLLDDTDAAVSALNEMLARRGLDPITTGFYRDHFSFPVRPFYSAIGVDLDREDWDAIAEEYHAAYARQTVRLADGAREALSKIEGARVGQSLVSALRQDKLLRDVARFGLAGHFEFVCGTDNLDGASKLDRARDLAARIRERYGEGVDMVLVGDALHDKEVADETGMRCVLFSGGSHAAWRLRAVAPVADTLDRAVEIALEES